jgi:hypothetical protein
VRMGRRSHHQCHRGLHPPAAQEDRTGRRPHPDRTRPGYCLEPDNRAVPADTAAVD